MNFLACNNSFISFTDDEDHCAEYGGEDKSLRNALADVWFLSYDRVSNTGCKSPEDQDQLNQEILVPDWLVTCHVT